MPKIYRGMMETENLIRKSLNVHNILTQYIEVHNDIFKSSLRRIIPIPGVFKAIDFGKYHGSLSKLTDELKYIMSGVDDRNDFARALIEYIQALVLSSYCGICAKIYIRKAKERYFHILKSSTKQIWTHTIHP